MPHFVPHCVLCLELKLSTELVACYAPVESCSNKEAQALLEPGQTRCQGCDKFMKHVYEF